MFYNLTPAPDARNARAMLLELSKETENFVRAASEAHRSRSRERIESANRARVSLENALDRLEVAVGELPGEYAQRSHGLIQRARQVLTDNPRDGWLGPLVGPQPPPEVGGAVVAQPSHSSQSTGSSSSGTPFFYVDDVMQNQLRELRRALDFQMGRWKLEYHPHFLSFLQVRSGAGQKGNVSHHGTTRGQRPGAPHYAPNRFGGNGPSDVSGRNRRQSISAAILRLAERRCVTQPRIG